MDPVIQLRAVVSLLGRFPALAGVDLDVVRGEVVALHGPNGAGKTTLLRLCAGMTSVVSGEARVLGYDPSRDRRALRQRVGLLGHRSGLYDDLTVADNVRFWARAARVPDAAAEATRVLASLGVGGRLATVPAARLSAGQQRRAALACLVVRRPELWLLDEPHAGLDAGGRDLLDGLIAQAAAAGATVLLASHEHERVAGLRCRVVGLAGGLVVEDRPSDAVGVARGGGEAAGVA